ncbi:hypothetical protein GH714_006612 [Hevea brasiliensis]|uniref:Ribonuclease H1 N-terminal domain-containing protein n=1 Tax=Hevea brasiliensis TaxID=3981 RepID=A0A6A6MA33_HEVBR|nr:hypothetical protein GH714_006612 [Hevea brasiliensis]
MRVTSNRRKEKFYVVFHGLQPGIYTSWQECAPHVIGVSRSLYKSYDTMEEALHAFNHANNLPMNSYRGGDGMSLVASSGISTTLGNEEPCQQYLSTINMESKKSLMFGKEDPREESPSISNLQFSQEGVFKKARFEKGWRAFVQENQLGKDDEVEFTLTVADDYRIEFQTEITRAGQ